MRKFYLLLTIALVGMASCHQDLFDDYEMFQQADFSIGPSLDTTIIPIAGDNITLGTRLLNPYSVTNMRRAYDNISNELIDAGIERDDITTTHFYVRFKPNSEEELRSIKNSYADFAIYEYPLDYELNG